MKLKDKLEFIIRHEGMCSVVHNNFLHVFTNKKRVTPLWTCSSCPKIIKWTCSSCPKIIKLYCNSNHTLASLEMTAIDMYRDKFGNELLNELIFDIKL